MNGKTDLDVTIPNGAPVLTLDDYQDRACKTYAYDPNFDPMCALALEISGEAGEVADQVKRIFRDDGGKLTAERRAKIVREIGDTLWGLANLADRLDMFLSDVAAVNLEKLEMRRRNGKLLGEGENR